MIVNNNSSHRLSSLTNTHAAMVCRALRATDWGHSSMGEIVKDTVSVGLLRTFSFSYTRRQDNCTVYILAKKVIIFFFLY